MSIPPSPALSLCDSLSSEDLDAYLDSLPPLDSLPSREVNEAWWTSSKPPRIVRHDSVTGNEHDPCGSCEDCAAVTPLPGMIVRFLENAQLPSETIAIAYNILSSPRVASLHCWHGSAPAFQSQRMWEKMVEIHGPQSDASCQRALVILSALSLAVAFSDEVEHTVQYWSTIVGEGAFSTEQIGATNRILLAQLDWQIDSLATPEAVNTAIGTMNAVMVKEMRHNPLSSFNDEPLKHFLGPQTSLRHGLITPDDSPDCSVMDD